MAAGHSDTFHHVRDFGYFELPRSLGLGRPIYDSAGHEIAFGVKLPEILGLQITKFMVLQLVAAVIVLLIFRGLAKRAKSGEPVRGRWWNFWESLALFIRDEVVRPTIGTGHHHGPGDHDSSGHHDSHGNAGYDDVGETEGASSLDVSHQDGIAHLNPGHPADKYLPFVWSCFFYVLICNLLGAIPWMGSATGEINVTAALALTVFGAVVYAGSREQGVGQFWISLAPSMDLPGVLKIVIVPMVWVIEFGGLLIKHAVLAVRLFANIMAGHTVIAVILGFIAVAEGSLFYLVAPASVLGQVAIGLLELFVAFLQAYVFAFLATLFLSAAVHPH